MTELGPLLDAHTRALDSFGAMLVGVPAEKKIPHLEWNVGELAAHILAGVRTYTAAATDDVEVWTDLERGADENARILAATVERDPSEIAAAIPVERQKLHKEWKAHAGSDVVWGGGLKVPVESVVSLHITDVLVHGWDLSKATGKRWEIARADAILGIAGPLALAPHFVAPEAANFVGTYEIRLRGNGRYTLEFDRGSLAATEGGTDKADCRMSADPKTFLLTAYGRIPVWRSAATGGVVAFGRKPWLGFKFKSLLRNP